MNLINLESAARAFSTSYLALKALFDNGTETNNQELMLQFAPMVVILSFSLEIELKYLINSHTGNQVEGHDLKVLFNKLQPDLKEEIKQRVIQELSLNGNEFNNRLNDVKNSFQKWRYFYEGDRTIDFEFLKCLHENIKNEL